MPRDADYRQYLEFPHVYAGNYQVAMHGYYLMPNHAHLVLAPGARVAADSATVRIADDYDQEALRYFEDSEDGDWSIDFTAESEWYIVKSGVLPQDWEEASLVPNEVNTSGEVVTLAKIRHWNTPWEPYLDPYIPHMGHNGGHTVWLNTVDEQPAEEIPFQVGTETPVASGPSPLVPDVRNLVITNVTTNNGTVDYFKYDPEPGSKYHRPVISYTVEDDGDQQEYDFYFIVRPTGAHGWDKPNKDYPEAYGWDWSLCNDPSKLGEVSFTWNGSSHPGAEEDTAEWGTYTFEVFAYKYYPGEPRFENWIDWFYYKWPYCLSVGTHTAWVPEPVNKCDKIYSDITMRYYYMLVDYCDSNPSLSHLTAPVTDFNIIVVDNQLHESNPDQFGGDEINTLYDGLYHDGLIAKLHKGNMFYFDDWRVIVTGNDNCWKIYRRDHDGSRMIAMNYKVPRGCRSLNDSELMRLMIAIEFIQVGMEGRTLTTQTETWYVPAFSFYWTGNPQRINPGISPVLIKQAQIEADRIYGINQFERKKHISTFKFLVKDSMWDSGLTIWKDAGDSDWVIIFGGAREGEYSYRVLQRSPLQISEILLHELIHGYLGRYANWKYLKTEQLVAPIGIVYPIPFDVENEGITYLASREFVTKVAQSVLEQRAEARANGEWDRYNYLTMLLNRAQREPISDD